MTTQPSHTHADLSQHTDLGHAHEGQPIQTPPAQHSIEVHRGAKGEYTWTTKIYCRDEPTRTDVEYLESIDLELRRCFLPGEPDLTPALRASIAAVEAGRLAAREGA